MNGHAPTVRRLARLTGLLYIPLLVFGMFAPIIFETFIVPGDSVATADRILGSRAIFSASLVSWIVIVVVDVAISVVFYALLEPVSRLLSAVSAALRLTYSIVIAAILPQLFHGYSLLSDPTRGARFEATILEDQALSYLESFGVGFQFALVIFGIHLVFLGALLHRSRLLPVFFGIVLVVAGVGYVLDSLGRFFLPDLAGPLTPLLLAPALIGELGLTVWLLTRGIRLQEGE